MKKLILMVILIFGVSSAASALITPEPGSGGLDVYEAINTLLGTGFSQNSDADYLQATPDKYWHDFSSDKQEGGYIAIGVSANNLNRLNVFGPIVIIRIQFH